MPTNQSILLGFVGGFSKSFDVSPSCSSYGSDLTCDDVCLEKAISDCQHFRRHPYVSEGVLLKCIDAHPLFPYLHCVLVEDSNHSARTFAINEMIRKLDVGTKSLFGAYDEAYTINVTALMVDTRLPTHRNAGYIIICFKLLEDQSQKRNLESTWLGWTGAREIYKYAPRNWNLRRITLHKYHDEKSGTSKPFAYVLMCEFGSICHPSNRLQALDLCERLRVRNCGYISLFQVGWNYSKTEGNISSEDKTNKERNPMMRGLSQEVEPVPSYTIRNHPKPLLRGRSLGYRHYDDPRPNFFGSYQHYSFQDDHS